MALFVAAGRLMGRWLTRASALVGWPLRRLAGAELALAPVAPPEGMPALETLLDARTLAPFARLAARGVALEARIDAMGDAREPGARGYRALVRIAPRGMTDQA